MEKCRDCGKELRGERGPRCSACFAKFRSQQGPPPSAGAPPFGGYFDENKRLRQAIFKDEAVAWAEALSREGMTPAAMRRFYNQLRGVELALKAAGDDFESILPQVWAFERDAAYARGRNVVPAIFETFIQLNVAEAAKSREHFFGFVQFFQSVIAYSKGMPQRGERR